MRATNLHTSVNTKTRLTRLTRPVTLENHGYTQRREQRLAPNNAIAGLSQKWFSHVYVVVAAMLQCYPQKALILTPSANF